MHTKNWFWAPITLTLTQSITWDSGKRNVNWESDDGYLIILNGRWNIKYGFNWNGASGVPDGSTIDDYSIPVLSSTTKVPITWLASLIHDASYTYMDDANFPYTRKELDIYFRQLLKDCGFKYSNLYWWGVRKLGKLFHTISKFISAIS